MRRGGRCDVALSSSCSRLRSVVARCAVKSCFLPFIVCAGLVAILHSGMLTLHRHPHRRASTTVSSLSLNLTAALQTGCAANRQNDLLGLPVAVAEQCTMTSPDGVNGSSLRAQCKLLTCRNLLAETIDDTQSKNEAPTDLRQLAVDFMTSYPVRHRLTDADLSAATADCALYRKLNRFDVVPIVPEAVEFPLAYNVLVHRDAQQVARLLRAIYRPQNVYCIHVDTKSRDEFRAAILSLVNCFDNVRLASRHEAIVYAGFSRLQKCTDHGLVTCRISNRPGAVRQTRRQVRCWQRVDRQQFIDAIRQSDLAAPPAAATATELFDAYHRILGELALRRLTLFDRTTDR